MKKKNKLGPNRFIRSWAMLYVIIYIGFVNDISKINSFVRTHAACGSKPQYLQFQCCYAEINIFTGCNVHCTLLFNNGTRYPLNICNTICSLKQTQLLNLKYNIRCPFPICDFVCLCHTSVADKSASPSSFLYIFRFANETAAFHQLALCYIVHTSFYLKLPAAINATFS